MNKFNFVVSALALVGFIGVLLTLDEKEKGKVFMSAFIVGALALAVSVFVGGMSVILGVL